MACFSFNHCTLKLYGHAKIVSRGVAPSRHAVKEKGREA